MRYVKFETLNQLNRVQLAGPVPSRSRLCSKSRSTENRCRGSFQSGRHQQMLARVHFSIPLSARGVPFNPYQSWDTQQIDRIIVGRCHCLIPREQLRINGYSIRSVRSISRPISSDLKMLDDCRGRPIFRHRVNFNNGSTAHKTSKRGI